MHEVVASSFIIKDEGYRCSIAAVVIEAYCVVKTYIVNTSMHSCYSCICPNSPDGRLLEMDS